MLTREERNWPSFCNSHESINWRRLVRAFYGAACLVLVVALISCAPKYKTQVPTYEQAKKQVLAQKPLVDDPIEEREPFLKGGRVGPVKNGTKVTVRNKDNTTKDVEWGAVVLDDKKVAEYSAIKAERDRLRKDLEIERLRARTKEIIYKASVAALAERGKRTWWEKNKGVVSLTIGGTLGAALIVGLVYALTGGRGLSSVSTNTMIFSPLNVTKAR